MLIYADGFKVSTRPEANLREAAGLVCSRVVRENRAFASLVLPVGFMDALEAALNGALTGMRLGNKAIRGVAVRGMEMVSDTEVLIRVDILTDDLPEEMSVPIKVPAS